MKKLMTIVMCSVLLFACSPKEEIEEEKPVEKVEEKFVIDEIEVTNIIDHLIEIEKDGLSLEELSKQDDERIFVYALQLVVIKENYQKEGDDYIIAKEDIDHNMKKYLMRDDIDSSSLEMLPYDESRKAFVSPLNFGIYNNFRNVDLEYEIEETNLNDDMIIVEVVTNEGKGYLISINKDYNVKSIIKAD